VDPFVRQLFETSSGKPSPLVVLRVPPAILVAKMDQQFVYAYVDEFRYGQNKQKLLHIIKFVLDLHINDPRELSIAEALNSV
jgi:hypothetical protein